jgi:hypothetical protein
MYKFRKYAYALSFCGTAIGCLAVTRSFLSGEIYSGTEELYGKTAIITGGNRGIGDKLILLLLFVFLKVFRKLWIKQLR